jgi:ribosome-associated protein
MHNVNMDKLVSALSFETSRSGGPGGQHVNKVNTRVTAVLDVSACTELDNAQKRRIRSKLRTRCDKEGHLRVVSQKFRTQAANRRAAVERMMELVRQALARTKPRIPTQPTMASRQRRLDGKKQRSRTKQARTIISPQDPE